MSLNPKQEQFCQEYLIDLNGTQAATRAGYSEKTANEQGSRLLANVNIQIRIAELMKERLARVVITQDYVLGGLQEVAERCMQRAPVMVYDRENKCMMQAIDEETSKGIWTFDSSGANRSLELLGKHLGTFTEKIVIDGNLKLPASYSEFIELVTERLKQKKIEDGIDSTKKLDG